MNKVKVIQIVITPMKKRQSKIRREWLGGDIILDAVVRDGATREEVFVEGPEGRD